MLYTGSSRAIASQLVPARRACVIWVSRETLIRAVKRAGELQKQWLTMGMNTGDKGRSSSVLMAVWTGGRGESDLDFIGERTRFIQRQRRGNIQRAKWNDGLLQTAPCPVNTSGIKDVRSEGCSEAQTLYTFPTANIIHVHLWRECKIKLWLTAVWT